MNTNRYSPQAGAAPRTALIVGGGLIGCAIAYELGKAGYRCTVLDKGPLLQEASTAAAGMLGAQVELHHPGPFYAFCRYSLSLYRAWTEELERISGVSVEYRDEGILRAAFTEADELELRGRLSWMQDARWLDRDELLAAEPELSPDVRGGLQLPADHQLHPRRLAQALKAALVRQGCELRENTPVFELTRASGNGRVTGVRTAEGTLDASLVVLSAGAWSPGLADAIGLRLPIFPVKGQCISLRPSAPISRFTLFTQGCYIVPKEDGTCLVGATQVEAGFDKRATAAAVGELHARAARLLPALADAELADTWAGLRPGTRDGLPFLGWCPDAPGLMIATGHYRNGILLAPATGRIVRELADGETPEVALDAFAPGRATDPALI